MRMRDPLDKIDRRKQKAEKKQMQEERRMWRRRRRADEINDFKKGLNSLFSRKAKNDGDSESQPGFSLGMLFTRDPYARSYRKRRKEDEKERKAQEKRWRQEEREENRQILSKRINRFLSNPFAKRELSEEQLERQQFRRLVKLEKKKDRQKWWAKFRNNPWRIILPRKKRRDPDGGYLYVYHMTKLERKELAQQKRRQARENFKMVLTTPEYRQKFIFGYLHSTAYFILAFMLIYVVYQVITILVASSYHIPVIWYYYRLKFAISDFSPLYTRQNLVLIFAVGPIFSLLLAFVFLRLYFTKNVNLKRFQLFFLWGFICGVNMFFGAYIAGFITRTEFIYTSEWLFMSNVFDIEEIIFSAIAFIVMLMMSRMVMPLFLLASGSVSIIKPEVRLFYVLTHIVLPWITGVVVMFLITLPQYYVPLILKTLTPGLILLPALYLYDLLQYENIHRTGEIQRTYFRWSIVIIAVAVLFFYRIVLSWGLYL
jgi:hypothetical protein